MVSACVFSSPAGQMIASDRAGGVRGAGQGMSKTGVRPRHPTHVVFDSLRTGKVGREGKSHQLQSQPGGEAVESAARLTW